MVRRPSAPVLHGQPSRMERGDVPDRLRHRGRRRGDAGEPRPTRPGDDRRRRQALLHLRLRDDWYHVIKLESTAPRSVDAPPARVLAGRRVAPPDDCGGIYGYHDLVDAVSDPEHPDHAEMLDWLGVYGRGPRGYFDPAYVSIEDLDADVREALNS